MPGVLIAGCGGYAAVHAAELGKLRGVRLLFSSREPARARAFARRFGGSALGGLPEALSDPRVEGVVLCGPHDRHLPDALAALGAGKAVLLEKPLARSPAEGLAIARAVRSSRGRLMLAENFAFLPHLAGLRSALPGLGAPLRFEAEHRRRIEVSGWRRSRRRMGGGVLIDMGVHYLRLLQMLFGPALRARCLARARKVAEMEGESDIEVELEFSRRTTGRLLLSWSYREEPWIDELRVHGPAGSAAARFRSPEIVVEKGLRRGVRRFAATDLRGRSAVARAFLRLLRGARPAPGVREGLEDLRVVAAAYRSAAAGGKWRAV